MQTARELMTRNGAFYWARSHGFRVSRARIDWAIAAGSLPAVKVGPRSWAIALDDLKAFLAHEAHATSAEMQDSIVAAV